MFHVARTLGAPLFAIALASAPVTSHAQDVAAPVPASVAPITKDDCPADYPVKGNKSGCQEERLVDPMYHVSGLRWYAVPDPEECFATAAYAEAAGNRAPLR